MDSDLELKVSKVTALKAARPAIDLAHDELIGQPWYSINFGWLWAFMEDVDLRGANLEKSQWSKRSDLSHSYLQCADLQGAVFRGANLAYADLRGANVQGANFRGAKIKGMKLTHLYGIAKWPRWRHITTQAVKKWNVGTCLRNRNFWDNQPASPPPQPSRNLVPHRHLGRAAARESDHQQAAPQ